MLVRILPNVLFAGPRTILALVVTVVLFAVFPPFVAAQQPAHAIFSGKGFINDQPAADGAVGEAWVRGQPVSAAKIVGSKFRLSITQPPDASSVGAVFWFKLSVRERDTHTR